MRSLRAERCLRCLAIGFLLLLASMGGVGCGGSGDDAGDGDGAGNSGENAVTDNSNSGTSSEGGPGNVLDVEAARQTDDLEVSISDQNSRPITVQGDGFQAETYRIEYTFRSQRLWETDWEHKVTLYVPTEINAEAPDGAFAVIQHGTENTTGGVSASSVFRRNYAGYVAGVMGIPAMVVSGIPGSVDLSHAPDEWQGEGPSSCFGSELPTRRYTSCLLTILRRTSDLRADPFRHIAHAWMRVISSAEHVAEQASSHSWQNGEPVDFSMSRAVVMADGERAVGARMAAVADSRIDGVFANADFGSLDVLLETMQEAWPMNFGWFDEPGAFAGWLELEAGQAWRATVDPASWKSEWLGDTSFVNSIGTNDPRFPLAASAAFGEGFPDDEARRVVVPGYANGIGAPQHLMAWYQFIANVYFGRELPEPTATITRDRSNIEVEATVDGGASVEAVSASYVQQHRSGDDRDFRDTHWVESTLEESNGAWTGSVAPIVNNSALVVQSETTMTLPTVLEEGEIGVNAVWTSEAWVEE